ncbi:hypothetical protein KAU09_02990 [Candidatus Parcubacteria bacterium]|nr:hypothetical protein [Candidatus Parcubacteria bacterium]
MNNIYKDKKIFKAGNDADDFVKYLIGFFLILVWTAVILFFTPILGRPIISGYVLLLIFISFFQRVKVVLFTTFIVFLCYGFLFFIYPYEKTFRPILDFLLLFLSASAIIFITRNVKRHYSDLFEARHAAEEIKASLEVKVVDRTKELKELSQNLEKKIQERTKAIERTRGALVNLLEDAEYAKRKIEEEKNKTRAAFISLSDGLILFDREKKISLINPEAEKILRVKESNVSNKTIDEIDGVNNLDALYNALGRKIEWTGKKYQLVLEKPVKKFFQVLIIKVAIKDDIIGLMVVLHDITRDKEIDQMKTEFISIAAHQLRTPLSAVKWTLRMIINGNMGEIGAEVADYLKQSYQSNERMINLVNDLLNVSHIEEGHFLYELKSVSMRNLIQDVISDSAALAAKQKIKIEFNMPKNGLFKINADYKKIELAIQNLVDNAIKYSIPGNKVIVSLEKIKEKGGNFIQIEIKDYGIGISNQVQKRLFSKFFRGKDALKLQTEGSGLGLFIVKNIIKAHNGKIWFKSEKNKGTTFYVRLLANK